MKRNKEKKIESKSKTIIIIISDNDSKERHLPKLFSRISKNPNSEVKKALSSVKKTLDNLAALDDFSDVLSKKEIEELRETIDSIGKRSKFPKSTKKKIKRRK